MDLWHMTCVLPTGNCQFCRTKSYWGLGGGGGGGIGFYLFLIYNGQETM